LLISPPIGPTVNKPDALVDSIACLIVPLYLAAVRNRWTRALAWAPEVVLIVALASLSAFDVFEQDIFWQIRAGDEILRGLGLQQRDTWSLTARGMPSVNFEWLSTVLIRAVYGVGGVRALIALRVALAAAMLGSAALLIHRHVARERARNVALLLLPVFYVTIAFKIEVRSDTFVFLIFAGLLLLWSSTLIVRTKMAASLALTIVATNLHAGTAPFVALAAMPFICALPMSAPRRLGWSIAHVLALLANPYGWKILPILWEHIAYSHYNKLDNFDHASLSFSKFSLLNFGIAAWTWVPLALAGWVGFVFSRRDDLKARRAPALIEAAVGLTLTAMAANRVRAFPYHLLFFLPFLASLLDRILSATRVGSGERRHRLRRVTFWIAAVGASAWLVGRHVEVFTVTYDVEVSRSAFPVGSAAFIYRERPRANLFHTYGFGGYFVWALREYKTFVDTRETMFRHMQSVMLEAQKSPAFARQVWDEYQINTAIIPTPETRYIEGIGFEDAIAPLFPPEQWAIVYFDDISTVLVRRIPEHQAIIRDNEFVLLRPHIPANHYVVSKSRSPEKDARFIAELSRCERNEPENLHCAIAHSARLRLWDNASAWQPARDRMISLARKGKRNVPFLVELATILRVTGDTKRAQTVDKQIIALTNDS
jgi:hypothetical protein